MILKEQTNVPLAANAQWVTGWFENNGSLGEVLAVVSVYTDQYGQFEVCQTDQTTNPAMWLPCGGPTIVIPKTLAVQQVPVTHLYWRVTFGNGITAQTQFDCVVSASASLDCAVLVELQRVNFNLRRLTDPYKAQDDTLNLVTGSF